ncbi:MAG: hypothetical protein PVF58_14370 [Candidatus Methanofastidiosia archaeon]|jgi:hypothetical protein
MCDSLLEELNPRGLPGKIIIEETGDGGFIHFEPEITHTLLIDNILNRDIQWHWKLILYKYQRGEQRCDK